MIEQLNGLLDTIWFGLVLPFFLLLSRILSLVFITPLAALHVPLSVHICLLAVLTGLLSFFLRRLLRVEEKSERFNAMFAEKRRRQQNLQMIPEKYSREALYRVTDDELNDDFNRYLAQHYARYVLIYLLPVFLIMAWLNSVFDDNFLLARNGIPYVLGVPENSFGIQGLSVTFVFLLAYVTTLIVGFQIGRRRHRSNTPTVHP